MTQEKAANGLDFEALRLGIERCDPEIVLGFYAEDAQLSIVNAVTPRASPFELCGKAEIAKHLRAIFGQEASHRVERDAAVGENRVTFREACEYSDGAGSWSKRRLRCATEGSSAKWMWWQATHGRIVRRGAAEDRPPVKYERRGGHDSANRLLCSKQATEKED